MFYAYCYASGEIEFGTQVPDGTLLIDRTTDSSSAMTRLRNRVTAAARHAQDGSNTLLVPGVPEAANELDAVEALNDWMNFFRFKGELKNPRKPRPRHELEARSTARLKRSLNRMCAA